MTGHPCFDGCEICQAALVAEWSGRLDRFCAELATKGFRIQREGLSVRIDVPETGANG